MGKCIECGAPTVYTHHIIPVSRGGTATVPICQVCHDLVHDRRTGERNDDHATLTKEALALLRDAGVRLGGLPYGWKRTDKRDASGRVILEEVEEEMVTVNRVLDLRRRGVTLRNIAKFLGDEGHPTKKGGPWQASTIQGILRLHEKL